MPHFTTRDGCRLYYEITGAESSQPTIVFLNGTAQTTLSWYSAMRSFKARFRVLLYDARGQGRSDLGAGPLSLEGHLSDLQALLSDLEIAKVHCVGLSHGVRIALALAQQAPERVDRLVLCSFGSPPSPRSRAIVRSWLEILQCAGLEAMAWAALPVVFGNAFLKREAKILDKLVQAMVLRNKKEALIAHLEAMLRYAPLSFGKQTSFPPCLALAGSDDPLVSRHRAEELAVRCAGRHEELDGIGHSIPVEAPEVFNRLVAEFLA